MENERILDSITGVKLSVILNNLVSTGSLENHEIKFTSVFSASFQSGLTES